MSTDPDPRPTTGSATLVRRRLLAIVVLLLAGGIFAFFALGDIDENLVYYWGPTELLEKRAQAEGAAVRLGGLVVPGSVRQSADSLDLDFEVTDGKSNVAVHAETVPPAMFRGGIGVVLEGELDAGGVFQSSRLMIKHDNEYRAPGAEDDRSVEELVRSLRFEPSDT
jgi:cytochrome c-type biogenesis protein CcmE